MKDDTPPMSQTDKASVESCLKIIAEAIEIGEYEVALTTIERLKQTIVDTLMVKHYGQR